MLSDELERQNVESFEKELKIIEGSRNDEIEKTENSAKDSIERLESKFKIRKKTIEEALALEVDAHEAAGKAIIKIEDEIRKLEEDKLKTADDLKLDEAKISIDAEQELLDDANSELEKLEKDARKKILEIKQEGNEDEVENKKNQLTILEEEIKIAQEAQLEAQNIFNDAQLVAEATFGVDLNVTLDEQITAKKLLLVEAEKEEIEAKKNKVTAEETFAIDIKTIDRGLERDRAIIAARLVVTLEGINNKFEADKLKLAQDMGVEAKKTNDEMIQGLKDVLSGLEKVENLTKDRTSAFADSEELEDAKEELTALENKRDRLKQINDELDKIKAKEDEAKAGEVEGKELTLTQKILSGIGGGWRG